jgi:hypothetical protein
MVLKETLMNFKNVYSKGFSQVLQSFKKELPSLPFLPSEPPTISQPGFGSSIYVARIVTLWK